MKINSTCAVLIAIVCMFDAGCRSSGTSLMQSARGWQDAVNAKNVDALMVYFADDSVAFYPRHQPSLNGNI